MADLTDLPDLHGKLGGRIIREDVPYLDVRASIWEGHRELRRSGRDLIKGRVGEYYWHLCHGALESDLNFIASVPAEHERAVPGAGGIACRGFALTIFDIAQDSYLGR